MNLPGLISGAPPPSSGGEGKPAAPGPADRAQTFGAVVNSKLPRRMTPDGADEAAPDNRDAAEPQPGQPASRGATAENTPATDPAPGPVSGAQPTLPLADIAAAPPASRSPDLAMVAPPGASGGSATGDVGVSTLRKPQTAASVLAATGEQPARLAGAPANATGAESPAAMQRLPGGNSAVSTPLPPDASEAALVDARKTASASPNATSDAPGATPAAAPAREANSTALSVTGIAPAGRRESAPSRGATSPGAGPGSTPRPGQRGAGLAPDAAPASASAPPTGGSAINDGAEPISDLPDIPAPTTRARGAIVRNAVVQARGEFEQFGLVASAAATTQSSGGPAQSLATALSASAGGAEIARAVAPQIAMAIGTGPGAGQIELRLDPPELGKVGILLEITDQSLRATILAERPATNELLRRHGEILLTQLQQAGFAGIDLQFAGTRAGNQGSAQPGDPARPAYTGDPNALADGENADVPASRDLRRNTDGLDLRL